jgi:NADPH2:quinone reductase
VPDTMRAIRLTGPVASGDLAVTEVPIPDVRPGWGSLAGNGLRGE